MEYGLVALWLALYLGLLVAGSVVASVMFPRFEDYGSGVAVPLSLTVIWLVTFFVGRLSLTVGIWLGVVVLAVLTVLAGTRSDDIDVRRIGETAVVFSLAFLFLAWLRVFAVPLGASDPVIAALPLAIGEKFLDFGLLKSLVRAETLPPEDMWFAGKPVAYYYGGHLVAAILTRITGTAGRFAYNLALAGFYAMLVTAVYGLASNVAAEREIPRRLAGGLSAFAVGIAGNLSTPGKYLLGVLPDFLSEPLASAIGIETADLSTDPGDFYYFDASRIITDEKEGFAFQFEGAAGTTPTINEFPFFAWFNGDMHAHMMSTGFLLLAVAICFSYYQTPAREVRRRRLLLFGALPPVAGLLAVANTWSFPAPAGLALLTVFLAPPHALSLLPGAIANRLPDNGLGRDGSRLLVGIGTAVAVVALGILWSLPFWLGPASGRELSILPDRSSMGELLVVHGLFVAVFGAYLYGRSRAAFGDIARKYALATIVVVVLLALADLAALGLFLALVAGSWLLSRERALAERYRDITARAPVDIEASELDSGQLADGGPVDGSGDVTPPDDFGAAVPASSSDDDLVGFEAVLIVAGVGLLTLVEFVYMKESIGRMNTVFKVYMQVWVLWAVALGPALAWLLARRLPSPSADVRSAGIRVALVLVVASSGLYAPLAISSSYDADDPTLDGLNYLESEYPDEAEAIHWLDKREGQPTIVTAAPGGYRWDASRAKGASAPASLTGVPTVLGWFHERQYRGNDPYQQRLGHVQMIYAGEPRDQATLLEWYDVQYVYVGPAERQKYGSITVDEVTGVEPVEEFGGVTIYRVDQNELP